MSFWKPLLLLLGFSGLVYGAADWNGRTSPPTELLARLGGVVGSLVIFAIYTYLWHIRPTIGSHRRTEFDPVPPSQAVELQRLAGSDTSLSLAAARAFALAVIEPSEFRQRIAETYEPGQRTLYQKVTIQGRIPRRLWRKASDGQGGSKYPSELFMPLLIPRKGELSDKLRLTARDGSELPAIAYVEYLQIAAKVLRILLMAAFDLKDPKARLSQAVLDVERRALVRLLHRGEWSNDGDPDPAQQLAELSAEKPELLKVAAGFIRCLSDRYALVANVPLESDRFLVSYERTVVPNAHFGRIRGWVRVLLGARPVDLTIQLDNATTCKSYHLIVECPEGLYLREQEVIGIGSRTTTGDGRIPPYSRFRSRSGQPYGHFYARFFDKQARVSPEARVRFQFVEVPPGSLFRAAIAAATCFLLILVVGSVISGAENHDPGSDAPAFLLAFPAVAATWLGFEAPSRRLFEGTLTARLSLLATALLSVAASALFMFYKSKTGLSPAPWPNGGSILGITEISWTVLAGLALMNGLVTGYMSWHRTWAYTHLCSYQADQKRLGQVTQRG